MFLPLKMDLSIITPTYKEKENLQRLIPILEEIIKLNDIDGEIIIVDDNSSDGTKQMIERFGYSNVNLIIRPEKLGIASAVKDGMNNAKGNVLVFMDADFSHPPEAIPIMYKSTETNDIIFGSRFVKGGAFKTAPHRWLGTRILNFWIKFLFKTKVKDYTNGFLAIKKEALDKVIEFGKEKNINPFDKVLFGIPLFVLGNKLSLKCSEVPIKYFKRTEGKTKIGIIDGIKIVFGDMIYAYKLKNIYK